jgi:hypothetical protein
MSGLRHAPPIVYGDLNAAASCGSPLILSNVECSLPTALLLGCARMSDDLPTLPEKPSLLDYLEQFLPFKLPRIPLPQTAKNLDKAAARLIDVGSINLAARMAASTARIRNRSRAEGEFIGAGSKAAVELALSDDALAQRAIEHALGAAVLAQHNREAVLETAAEELSHGEAADAVREIDDDWLNMFSELAAGKSDRDIQTLWGKILAGEIRNPGAFSLRTLSQLSTVTSEEANFIYRFMALVIEGDLLFSGSKGEFVSVNDGMMLNELGLTNESVVRILKFKAGVAIRQRCHNLAVEVTAASDQEMTIYQGSALTSFGQQLVRLCGQLEANRDYIEAFARTLPIQVGPFTFLSLDLRRLRARHPFCRGGKSSKARPISVTALL